METELARLRDPPLLEGSGYSQIQVEDLEMQATGAQDTRYIKATVMQPADLEKLEEFINKEASLVHAARLHQLLHLELCLGCRPQEIRMVPQETIKDIMVDVDGQDVLIKPIELVIDLEPDEQVVGFSAFTLEDPNSLGLLYYDPRVLLRTASGQQQMVYLSKTHFLPEPPYPGKLTWVPAEADPAGEDHQFCSIIGLRIMHGCSRDYVLGADFAFVQNTGFGWWCKAKTGQTAMFWFELLFLSLVLYYTDWLLDIKQLWLFLRSKMPVYFGINVVGILVPIGLTCWEAVSWSQEASPDSDFMRTVVANTHILPVALVAGVCSQLHIIILVALSGYFRKLHPFLVKSKHTDVIEQGLSAAVQMNFLFGFFAGIEQIEDQHLDADAVRTLALSVATSCFSLGLAFAGRDKTSCRVLDLPGKLSGWPVAMLVLVMVRSLEVCSRIAAMNILYISVRGEYAMAVVLTASALVAAALKLGFARASPADLLAGVFAHPGQVLEPASLLPLWVSCSLHLVLVVLAAAGQAVLHWKRAACATIFSKAKALPEQMLFAWLACAFASQAGLLALWVYGKHSLPQPYIEQLGTIGKTQQGQAHKGGRTSVMLTDLVTAIGSKAEPTAALASIAQSDCAIEVDDSAVRLLQTDESSWSWSHMSAAGVRVKLSLQKSHLTSEEWQGFFQNLIGVNVEEINFMGCGNIPAGAWQKLAGAKFKALKTVNFDRCFDGSGDGADVLLEVLTGSSETLERMSFEKCKGIPAAAWQKLAGAKFKALKTVIFDRCFEDSGDGADVLLESLTGSSDTLEHMRFESCWRIPAAAWQKLAGAKFKALKTVNFDFCFDDSGDGADVLLEVLTGSSETLERMSFEYCQRIPAAAWQELQAVTFKALQSSSGIPEHVLRLSDAADATHSKF